MKIFSIYGSIIDTDSERETFEDCTPTQVCSFLKKLDEGEDVVFEINSPGGSCTAGIAIANAIRKASAEGHKTTAKVVGLAASIASYIACACDEIIIDSNAFLMIHLPFTLVQGNSNDLKNEISNLEKFEKALVAVYRTKFDLTEDEIMTLLKAETWISGNEATNYRLNCTVNKVEPFKIAAKYSDKYKSIFNKAPNIVKEFFNMEEEKKEVIEETEKTVEEQPAEEEKKEEVVEERKVEEVVEETKEEQKTEEPVEQKTEESKDDSEDELKKLQDENEALKKELDECKQKLAECKPDEKVEERIAKCQSTFQNKINGFKDEIKAKDEELQKFKDSVSSLNTELDETKKELQKMSAAFEAKNNALAALNAGVLKPSEELPTFNDGLIKCKTLKERVEYINSGKFTK